VSVARNTDASDVLETRDPRRYWSIRSPGQEAEVLMVIETSAIVLRRLYANREGFVKQT
jgi:hypothetical protein